jgi:small subunit ribosomal protein S22
MKIAKEKLTMPPVLPQREERGMEIDRDPQLEGFDDSKWIFTDISMRVDDDDRRIVVREPNGVLREANWEERDRLYQVYFPRLGRHMWLPKLLTEEELPAVLARGYHLHVLDLVCVQCSPNSPDYIRVHSTVYDDIDKRKIYPVLHSTRYYGTFLWYLLERDNVEGIVHHLLTEHKLDDVEDLINLWLLIYPNEELSSHSGKTLIKEFCEYKNYTHLLPLLTTDVE